MDSHERPPAAHQGRHEREVDGVGGEEEAWRGKDGGGIAAGVGSSLKLLLSFFWAFWWS